jgi:hypothetical protein
VTRADFLDLARAADVAALHLRTARGLSPGRRADLAGRLRHLLDCLDAAEGRGIGAQERGVAGRVKGQAAELFRDFSPTDLDNTTAKDTMSVD